MYLSYCVSEKLNRKYMEDNYFIDRKKNFYCITDGHSGNFVSKYICDNFFKELENKIFNTNTEERKKINLNQFFTFLCKDIDVKLYDIITKFKKNDNSGTTLSSVFLINDKFYFLNVGDSITCLISNNKLIYVNCFHKPENEEEKKRIEKHYKVIFNRINGRLNISRTFGDFMYKNMDDYYNSAIIAKPELFCFELEKLKDKNSWILLASDGLYENYSIGLITQIINFLLCVGFKVEFISEIILNHYKFINSNDNLTFIIILLDEIKQNKEDREFFKYFLIVHKNNLKKKINENENDSPEIIFLSYLNGLLLVPYLKLILYLFKDEILKHILHKRS